MNDPSLERLDPDLVELLERAAPYPDPPDHAKARVRELVVHGILGGVGAGVGLPAGSESVPAASGHLWTLVSKPLAWVSAGFVAGAVTGATVRGALEDRPRERGVVTAVSARQTTAPSAVPSGAIPAPAPEVAPAPIVPRRSAERSPGPAPDGSKRAGASDLSAEQALLDTARAALVRGQAPDALAPLARHARQFPHGALSEERDALEVNALVASGRYAEARELGERFLAEHPGSLLQPSVRAALAAIP